MPIETTTPRSITPLPQPVAYAASTHDIREAIESRRVEDEYRADIIRHMNAMGEQTRCDPDMMSMQPELQWHMRPYLLDFLVESHLGLQLTEETLFLAVNIADRYSSKRVVFKKHYQLVGCASLWIASKYSDKKNKVPTLDELKLICCNMYEPHMFTQMELHILSTLDWSIGHPTVDLYLDLSLSKTMYMDMECDQSARHIALYLCENALYSKELMPFTPSVIAKSSYKLAMLVLSMARMPFEPSSSDEAFCMEAMNRSWTKPTACLERKYSRPEFSSVMQYIWDFEDYMNVQQRCYQQQMATPVPTPSRQDYISINKQDVHGYMTPPVSPEETPDMLLPGESKNIILMTTTADMKEGEYESLLSDEDSDDDCMEDDDDLDIEEDMSTVIYDSNSLA